MLAIRYIDKKYYLFSGPVEELLYNPQPDWKYLVGGPTESAVEINQILCNRAFIEGDLYA